MAMLMMLYMGFQMMPLTRITSTSSSAITVSPRIRPRRGFFALRGRGRTGSCSGGVFRFSRMS